MFAGLSSEREDRTVRATLGGAQLRYSSVAETLARNVFRFGSVDVDEVEVGILLYAGHGAASL